MPNEGFTMLADHTAKRFVAYYRVSTAKQGASGLGLEAQRRAVTDFLSRFPDAKLLGERVEIESGKNNQRPKLKEAMDLADLTGATLIIAKLDRLSRNAHFLTGLAERGIKFVACDMPDANDFTVTIMAALAQQERKMISDRTKAALQAAKARGVKLGNPQGAAYIKHLGNDAAVATIKQRADLRAQRLQATITTLKATGTVTAMGIAKALNAQHILTPRGSQWEAKGVIRLLQRLEASAA
jgi:DNA invertase Pin-like site-specific DNA recombinase